MIRPRHLALILLGGTALVPSAGSAATYRWVDEQGNTHYSDQLPPEQAHRRRAELSPQGRELKVIEAPKTAEELRREARLARLHAQHEKILLDQRKQDLALLRSYRSEEDIRRARDDKLQALEILRRDTETERQRQGELLARQEKAAAQLERKGESVSRNQRTAIAASRRAVAQADAKLEIIAAERAALTLRFERDLARFKVLQSQPPLAAPATAGNRPDSAPGPEPEVIPCADSSACDAAWARARDFLQQQAPGGLLTDSERLLQTPLPATDTDIGLVVTRLPGDGQEVLWFELRCRANPVGAAQCASDRARSLKARFMTGVGHPP